MAERRWAEEVEEAELAEAGAVAEGLACLHLTVLVLFGEIHLFSLQSERLVIAVLPKQ